MIVAARTRLAALLAGRLVDVDELTGRPPAAWPFDTAVAPAVWVDEVTVAPTSTAGVYQLTATVLVVTDAAPHTAGQWLDEVVDVMIDPPPAGWSFVAAGPAPVVDAGGELLEVPARAVTFTAPAPITC